MAQRKSFLLRIDPAMLKAVQRWADDDLRSLNAQIDFILRRALVERGRITPPDDPEKPEAGTIPSTPSPSWDKLGKGTGA